MFEQLQWPMYGKGTSRFQQSTNLDLYVDSSEWYQYQSVCWEPKGTLFSICLLVKYLHNISQWYASVRCQI